MTKMTEQELAKAIETISKAKEGDRITFTSKVIEEHEGGRFVVKQQVIGFYDGEGSWSGCSITETRTTYTDGRIEKRRECPNFRQGMFALKGHLEDATEIYDFSLTDAATVDEEF